MKTRTFKVILLVAIVARAGLLAAVWNHQERVYAPDSRDYIELSTSLVQEDGFQRNGQPEIFRTPGYPLLLAAGATWKGSWWRAVLIAQMVIDVALVHLTFVLGWMLVGERAGLIAAALQAISPLAIASAARILSDSLYSLLFIVALLLVIHHMRAGRWWPLLAGAAVMGAACYVRPVGLVMAAVFAVGLLASAGKGRWTRAGAFAGVVCLAVAPWVVRNAIAADYLGFSSFAGDSMYRFAAPEVIAATEGIPADQAREILKETDAIASRGQTPGQAAAARRGEALRIIGSHPCLYAEIHLKGDLGVLLPGATDILELTGLTEGNRGTIDVLHREGLAAAVRHYFGGNSLAIILVGPLLVVMVVQYLGTVACVVRRFSFQMPPEVYLAAAVVVVTVLLPGPSGLPRYRLPITPLLCMAAGAGLIGATKRPACQ